MTRFGLDSVGLAVFSVQEVRSAAGRTWIKTRVAGRKIVTIFFILQDGIKAD
jgi:hypothetical protein